MSATPFLTGKDSPLISGSLLFYAGSGQALEAVEAIQVVVRLPYCLYIPSIRYLFHFPGKADLVAVGPQKVWTKRAEGSTTIVHEQVVPQESVYLAGAQVITDWVGQSDLSIGDIQARNMEFDRDPNGYFRFTRLTLEFDWPVPSDYVPSEQDNDHEKVVSQIAAVALPLANYFVDIYRTVTGDLYLGRLPALVIEDIRIGLHDNFSIRKHERIPGGSIASKYGYHPNMLGNY